MEPTTLATTAGAWLWDKYGETVTGKTADAAKGRWDKFKWKDAAEEYRKKIKKLYGTMQIMGMAEPVPLDDIFTDAYMLDKPTAFGRFDIERLKQLSADPDAPPQAERVNGLRLVREKGNLFILGKPGAGKTTFLRYIALQAAEQNIDKIPIFITLKHWADSNLELMPFIPQPELERLITDYVRNVPPHDTNEATDGEVILKAIEAQHGIFVERARAVYSFSHLTFQEYFTAKYIVANAAKGTLTNLVKEHSTDGRWREVFLLTTSLLPDAGQFMKTFRRSLDELLGLDEKLQAILVGANKKSTSIQADSWLVRPFYLFVDLYYPSRGHDRIRDLARFRDLARSLARDLGLNKFARELAALSLPTYKAPTAKWQVFADKLRALMIEHRDIGHDWNLNATQKVRFVYYLNATRLLQDCLELAVISPNDKKVMLNSLYLPLAQAGESQDG